MKKILLVLAIIAFIFSSCQKEETNPTPLNNTNFSIDARAFQGFDSDYIKITFSTDNISELPIVFFNGKECRSIIHKYDYLTGSVAIPLSNEIDYQIVLNGITQEGTILLPDTFKNVAILNTHTGEKMPIHIGYYNGAFNNPYRNEIFYVEWGSSEQIMFRYDFYPNPDSSEMVARDTLTTSGKNRWFGNSVYFTQYKKGDHGFITDVSGDYGIGKITSSRTTNYGLDIIQYFWLLSHF